MAVVHFTRNLQRHVTCPTEAVAGATVADVFAAYFTIHPAVASYVLDDRGQVRRHVAVFVGDTQLHDPVNLSDPVADDTEIHVMQALSGG